ncbi:SLC13 family permease [Nitrosospira multiformis]|uniref:Transporter, YbiR family n=1 Tax=Nitrosospira multiformis TaxID=1231 RepID=A0A1I7GRQ9_9PROT|nr:SLC13 family permease [Nitrosospira multiformis]SFU51099.1 transporter, YbiR family [Nitrosospira multiformis]
MIQLSIQTWRKDYLLWFLAGLLIALTIAEPARLFSYPRLVDWPTIGGVAGLLVLAKGIELSGYLHRLGKRLIEIMRTSRSLATLLVLAAALLSMVLTNDVALFIMVPLTTGLHGVGVIPVTRLIIVEALAVNAGSALTPIGNPQNLFLWKVSGVSFHEYVQAMLPLALILITSLLVLIAFMFDSNRIQVREEVDMPIANSKLFHSSLILYLPFLILIDLHQAEVAVLLILMVFFIRHRNILVNVDWGLILVLALMFVNMRLITDNHTIHSFFTELRLDEHERLYFAGIALAQIMSNVPAAILLADYSSNWKLIAYAVNVGGFGFVLGSLANLIALRLARDRKAWLIFHIYSLPFLLVTGTFVYLLRFIG